MSWLNDDGLTVKFGNEQSDLSRVGRVSTKGDEQELVIRIVGSELAATATPTFYTDAGIPQGAHIVSATLFVSTAFDSAGDSATLTIGVFSDDGDGTYTVVDADGIDAAILQTAIDANGDQVACNGDMTSAPETLIAVSNNTRPVYVTAGYGTEAFTAGVADLVVVYRK
jgi:hypothetical protein